MLFWLYRLITQPFFPPHFWIFSLNVEESGRECRPPRLGWNQTEIKWIYGVPKENIGKNARIEYRRAIECDALRVVSNVCVCVYIPILCQVFSFAPFFCWNIMAHSAGSEKNQIRIRWTAKGEMFHIYEDGRHETDGHWRYKWHTKEK